MHADPTGLLIRCVRSTRRYQATCTVYATTHACTAPARQLCRSHYLESAFLQPRVLHLSRPHFGGTQLAAYYVSFNLTQVYHNGGNIRRCRQWSWPLIALDAASGELSETEGGSTTRVEMRPTPLGSSASILKRCRWLFGSLSNIAKTMCSAANCSRAI